MTFSQTAASAARSQVQRVERQVGRARAGVVARHAVLRDDGAMSRRDAVACAEGCAGAAAGGGGCWTIRNRLLGSGATARRHGRDPKVIDTGAPLVDVTVLPAAVIPASVASMSRTFSCSRNEPGSWTRERVLVAGGKALQFQQLEQQRRARHPHGGQPVLALGQAHHGRHQRVFGERPQLAAQAEALR